MTTGRLKSGKDKLNLDEWLHLAPDHPGRVRENHMSTECDGGRDSMIIERKEDGTANAHCFRCGRGGFYRGTRHFGSHRKESKPDTESHASSFGKTLPGDSSQEWGGFPRDVKEWLLRGGISATEVGKSGFWWSESQSKLWIEVRQQVAAGHIVVGYVVRGFNPKFYRTATTNPSMFYGYYRSGVINNAVMIVEDVVSAIKCSQVIDSIALMGTELKPAVASALLTSGYKLAYIFLDGDNPTVRLKARKIAKGLPFLDVRILDTGRDPKYYSAEQIKELLV